MSSSFPRTALAVALLSVAPALAQTSTTPPASSGTDTTSNSFVAPGANGQLPPGQQPVDAGGQQVDNQQMDTNGWDPDAINENAWFNNPQMQHDMGFNNDQFERLQGAYEQAYRQYYRQAQSLGSDLPAAERQERLSALRNDFFGEFNSRVGRDITPQQRQRFNQLYLQHRGVNAFNDPMYRDMWDFTPQQQQQLRTLQQEYNQAMRQFNRGGGDDALRQQQFAQLQQQTSQNLQGILNNQQMQQFQQLRGNNFDFTPNDFFGQTTSQTNNRATPGANIGLPGGNANPGSSIGSPGNPSAGSGVGTPNNANPGTGIGVPNQNTNPTGNNTGIGAPNAGGTGTGTSGTGTGTGTGGAGTGGAGAGAGGGAGGAGGGGAGAGGGAGGAGGGGAGAGGGGAG